MENSKSDGNEPGEHRAPVSIKGVFKISSEVCARNCQIRVPVWGQREADGPRLDKTGKIVKTQTEPRIKRRDLPEVLEFFASGFSTNPVSLSIAFMRLGSGVLSQIQVGIELRHLQF